MNKTTQWLATYGARQLRGGWLVTEQHIIHAVDYPTAFKIARKDCPKGESVLNVDSIPAIA